MKTKYFDTSALVKRYDPKELNATKLADFFQKPQLIYTSALTRLEAISAFRNKERQKVFDTITMQAVLQNFQGHISTEYKFIQIQTTTYNEAERLLLTHKLRTCDAMHIATALDIIRAAKIQPAQLEFYTSDKDQAAAANIEGFTVIFI